MRGIRTALVFASFLAMAGVASALPCPTDRCVSETWTNFSNPDDVSLSHNESYSYVHSIRNSGFDVGRDLVTSALLTIDLDNGQEKSKAKIYLVSPLFSKGTLYDFSLEDKTLGVSLLGLIELNCLGELSVTIKSLGEDPFNFDQSSLVATGWECAPVPEPGTFALLGTGLFAFAILFKRRFSR